MMAGEKENEKGSTGGGVEKDEVEEERNTKIISKNINYG